MRICEPSVKVCTDLNDPHAGSIGFVQTNALVGAKGQPAILMLGSQTFHRQLSLGWKLTHEFVKDDDGNDVLKLRLENLCDRHLFTVSQTHTGLKQTRITLGNSVEAAAQAGGDPDTLLLKDSIFSDSPEVVTTLEAEYVTPKGYAIEATLNFNKYSQLSKDPGAKRYSHSAYLALRLRDDNGVAEAVLADLSRPDEADIFGLNEGSARAVPFGIVQGTVDGRVEYGTFAELAQQDDNDLDDDVDGDGPDGIMGALLKALSGKGGKVTAHRIKL